MADNAGTLPSSVRVIRVGLWLQILVTVLLVAGCIYTAVLAPLAASGTKPFNYSGGFYDVPSLKTCVMPEGAYYYVWILVSIGLFFITIYAIIMVAQKIVLGQSEKQPGPLPLSAMVILVISLNLNTGWLFAEDNLKASGSFVLILFLLISNCLAFSHVCYNFYYCGRFLYRDYIADFWRGIAILNFMAIYVAWSLVQFCISFSVLLVHEAKYNKYNSCQGVIVTLLLFIIIWFIIENTVWVAFLNPVACHYLVLIWYMSSLYSSQVHKADKVIGFITGGIALNVAALILRLVIMCRQNTGNKIYGARTPSTAPAEDIVQP